jgi:hypothetical protein
VPYSVWSKGNRPAEGSKTSLHEKVWTTRVVAFPFVGGRAIENAVDTNQPRAGIASVAAARELMESQMTALPL